MRYRTLMLSVLLCTATYAGAQVTLFIWEPHVSIGINFPVYPEFVRVPRYPVYYAPRVNSNIFFYDGLYWVFFDGRWYASTWYNGPWGEVAPEAVPLYVLRLPLRSCRQPPPSFRAWAVDAPPRWDVYFGATWASQRSGWDSWNRSYVPAAAPLPVYQRQYSGSSYPTTIEQQQVLQSRQYRYQPRETVVQQYYRQNVVTTSVATRAQQSAVTQSAVTTRAQQSARTQSAQALAPGQLKNEQSAQSAKEFAPGQVKKQQSAQSAKEFAPGQVKRQQVAQSTQPVAPAPRVVEQRAPAPNARPNRGHGNREGDVVEGEGEGQAKGQGQGQGHGKGHGKD